MSLRSFLKKGKKALKGAVGGFIGGGVPGAIVGAIGGSITNGNSTGIGTFGVPELMSMRNYGLPALPTTNQFSASQIVAQVGRVARVGVGQVARRLPAVAAAVGAYQVGTMLYDAAGNLVGHRKRHRRINPMNMRAARRAIRRIKGARKMLQQIERQLPKQRAATRRQAHGSGRVTEFIRQG